MVWEEVEQRTSENTELSVSFVAFMVLAMQIAAVGILLDQPILIVGAMVVGPEFGPLAALSVALVERRPDFARRSLAALAVGFPAGDRSRVPLRARVPRHGRVTRGVRCRAPTRSPISSPNPDFFSFFVAFVAGIAGMLSLTSAKSGALIGVLISVTTIPAAANIGLAAAYGDAGEAVGAVASLPSTSRRSCWPAC